MANDILVKVGADISQFSRNIKSATKELTNMSTSANKITLGKMVGAIGITAAVAKGFNEIRNSVSGAVDRLDTLNNFPRVMERIGFSAEESKSSIDRLSDGIDGLPTTLDDVAGTAQRLAIMTKDLDGAVDTTLALNNAFLASGSDSANASRGLEQYVQMLSKGQVDLQSWRTLQETMGVALNDVAESFGFAGASAQNDLYDALKKGKIPFEDFNGKIIELSNKTGGFADIARDASGGIKTAWTNVQTAITRGVANVIKAFDEFLGTTSLGSIEQIFIRLKEIVSDFFNNVAENIPVIINKFREFYDIISPFIPLILKMAAGIGILLTSLSALNSTINLVNNVSGILRANLGILGEVFSFITSPIGLTVAAIGLLVAAFVIAYNKVEWFRDMVDEAWAWIKDAFFTALSWIKDNVVVPIMTEVAGFIDEILGKIREFWDKYGAAILNLAKNYFQAVWIFIKGVMGWIKGIFEIYWPIIYGVVKIAWEYIKLYVRNGIDLVMGIINTVMALIQGDWEGAWNSVKATVEKIWSNIKSFFESVDLVQTGKDIIKGLVKGIGSMGSAVWEATKGIGSKIKNGFTSFFKIKSPSRLMMSLAKHIPGGAIAGMDSMRNKVEQATDRMAEAMTPDVRSIDMSYATPSGLASNLSAAVAGTVDVNAREEMIAGAIDNLNRKLDSMRIEMNEREMGRFVSDVATESRDSAVRSGGRRRL